MTADEAIDANWPDCWTFVLRGDIASGGTTKKDDRADCGQLTTWRDGILKFSCPCGASFSSTPGFQNHERRAWVSEHLAHLPAPGAAQHAEPVPPPQPLSVEEAQARIRALETEIASERAARDSMRVVWWQNPMGEVAVALTWPDGAKSILLVPNELDLVAK